MGTGVSFAFNPNDPGKEQVLQWSSSYFREKILALQNEASSQGAKHGKGQAGKEAEYAAFLETNKATADAVRKANTVFEDVFLAAQGTDRLASLVFGDALIAASESLAEQRKTNPVLQRADASTFIDTFRQELLRESTNKEFISAIRDGKPLSEAAQNATQATKGVANPVPPVTACGLTNIGGCLDAGATWIIKAILLEFAGFLAWLASTLLNTAMQVGVFGFKQFAPDQIYAVWITARDSISLFLFFAGLFVGFMAIIGKSEDFQRYIVALIIYGLFVNFSYPLVRVFVDMSNVVALKIYTTTLGPGVLSSGDASSAGSRIVSSLGLTGLAASATAVKDGKTATNSAFTDRISSTPGALAAVIYILFSAYVIFMCAVLIIVRTALLVFFIAISPILLVDTIVPVLGEKAGMLRGLFFSQLMVAPVFAIMLALTLKFLNIFKVIDAQNTTGNFLQGAASPSSSGLVFFNLLIMAIMLYLMLKATKATSGVVGDTITRFANKSAQMGGGFALGATAVAGGIVGRQGIGRAMNAIARTEGAQRFKGNSWIGEKLVGGAEKLGGAKYDLRNLGATKALSGSLGLQFTGKGKQAGYVEAQEAMQKEVLKNAAKITDDEARTTYLDRKFDSLGARVGQTASFALGMDPNKTSGAKALADLEKTDDKVMEQYINASAKERAKMMNDKANMQYVQRFGKLDQINDSNLSEADKNRLKSTLSAGTQKALTEKEKYDVNAKLRDDNRVADYVNADTATRESMRAAAVNNKELLDKLDIMERYRSVDQSATDAIAQKVAILQELKDTKLAGKVIERDAHSNSKSPSEAVTEKQQLYKEVTGSDMTQAAAEEHLTEAVAKKSGESPAKKAAREQDIALRQSQLAQNADLTQTMQNQIAQSADIARLLNDNVQTLGDVAKILRTISRNSPTRSGGASTTSTSTPVPVTT